MSIYSEINDAWHNRTEFQPDQQDPFGPIGTKLQQRVEGLKDALFYSSPSALSDAFNRTGLGIDRWAKVAEVFLNAAVLVPVNASMVGVSLCKRALGFKENDGGYRPRDYDF